MIRAAGYPSDSSRGKAALTRIVKEVETPVILMGTDAPPTKYVTYKPTLHVVRYAT
jgi:hypothetical protein